MKPTEAEEAAPFLARDPRFRGIGESRATALVLAADALGGLDTALATPESRALLREQADVPATVVDGLASTWRGSHEETVRAWLSNRGLSPRQAAEAIETLGHGDPVLTQARVEADPYLLAEKVPGVGFERADRVAHGLGVVREDPRRAVAAGIYLLTAEGWDGHTWTSAKHLAAKIRAFTGIQDPDQAISTLQGRGLVVVRGERVGLAAFAEAEDAVLALAHESAEDLAPRLGEPDPGLTDEQLDAILLVTGPHRLSVISGAAGCGKTWAVTTLADLLRRAGLRVAFAAPTGKAARRLEELLREHGSPCTANTIHRLLEYHPFLGFRRGPDRPLEQDVVILDEASMLDVPLAGKLVGALAPGSRLVLVGDHHQLPPVGPGAVLRDLVETAPCPVARLETLLRQAGGLAVNAHRVLAGRRLLDDPSLRRHLSHGPEEAISATLELWGSWLDAWGPEALSRCQTITPRRTKAKITAPGLNLALQALVQERLYGRKVTEPGALLPGDKVVIRKNDYALDVRNGDQVTVLAITEQGETVVRLGDRTVTIPRAREHQVQLAYAISVHVAQGSEWDAVSVVLDTSCGPLLSRPLFYTAVTRATRELAVIGTPKSVGIALWRNEDARRRTWLR